MVGKGGIPRLQDGWSQGGCRHNRSGFSVLQESTSRRAILGCCCFGTVVRRPLIWRRLGQVGTGRFCRYRRHRRRRRRRRRGGGAGNAELRQRHHCPHEGSNRHRCDLSSSLDHVGDWMLHHPAPRIGGALVGPVIMGHFRSRLHRGTTRNS
jgi:hypothetical protein